MPTNKNDLPSSKGSPKVTGNFRRGAKRVKLHYVKLGPAADQAFRNLIRTGDDRIIGSHNMALAMSDKPLKQGYRTVRGRKRWSYLSTVLPRQATLYRRAWDGLGLVTDIPGIWNPEKFDKPKFDHAELDEGYADYTDWSDLNDPAELYIRTEDPDAYSQLIDGHDIYVLNRNTYETDVYDNEGVAYGDIKSTRCVWNLSPSERLLSSAEAQTVYEGVQSQDITEDSLLSCSIHGLHTPLSRVVLVKKQTIAWCHRRSRSPSCLMAMLQRPVSVPELEEMTGIKRRTIYDKINRQGLAIKIEEGKYWCLCHPLEEFMTEGAELTDDLADHPLVDTEGATFLASA